MTAEDPLWQAPHYMNLPGAQIVRTESILRAHDILGDVIKARGMACVHGGAGLGKTLSVTAGLHELAPQATTRIQFRSRPYPTDIRKKLFTDLNLQGEQPATPMEYDDLLKNELRAPFRVLVCDEAQQLSRECFEYWRHLWDDTKTDISVIFVGGGDCHRVLSREPMLASRIYAWQKFTPMQLGEVLEVIPSFHPLWGEADPEDIAFTNEAAAHGNFRAWAKITRHCQDGLGHLKQDRIDRKLLEWVFSRILH